MTATSQPSLRPGGARLVGPRAVVVGLAGGLLAGLLGVGGGIVMVPLLVLWFGVGQREAHAISLAAIIPISIGGIATYGAAGEVSVVAAIALIAGSIIGARLGAGLLARIDSARLQLVFGVFVVAAAIALALGA